MWKAHERKMKCTIAVSVLYVAVLFSGAASLDIPPELKEIVEAAHTTCLDETGVDKAVLEQAKNKKVFADDPKFKCFIKCMFQELHAMREDGSMDLELIEASLPAEVKDRGAIESLKQCLPDTGKDLCQAAFDMVTCMHNVNPKLSELFE